MSPDDDFDTAKQSEEVPPRNNFPPRSPSSAQLSPSTTIAKSNAPFKAPRPRRQPTLSDSIQRGVARISAGKRATKSQPVQQPTTSVLEKAEKAPTQLIEEVVSPVGLTTHTVAELMYDINALQMTTRAPTKSKGREKPSEDDDGASNDGEYTPAPDKRIPPRSITRASTANRSATLPKKDAAKPKTAKPDTHAAEQGDETEQMHSPLPWEGASTGLKSALKTRSAFPPLGPAQTGPVTPDSVPISKNPSVAAQHGRSNVSEPTGRSEEREGQHQSEKKPDEDKISEIQGLDLDDENTTKRREVKTEKGPSMVVPVTREPVPKVGAFGKLRGYCDPDEQEMPAEDDPADDFDGLMDALLPKKSPPQKSSPKKSSRKTDDTATGSTRPPKASSPPPPMEDGSFAPSVTTRHAEENSRHRQDSKGKAAEGACVVSPLRLMRLRRPLVVSSADSRLSLTAARRNAIS